MAEKKALSCAPSAPSSLEASLSLYASRLARLAPRLRPLPSALFLEGVAEKGSQGVTLDRVACDAAAKALALGSGRGGAAAAAEAFWPFAEKFYAASEALLSAPDSLCAFCGARRRLGCGEEGQWSLVVETELALRRRRRVVREPRVRRGEELRCSRLRAPASCAATPLCASFLRLRAARLRLLPQRVRLAAPARSQRRVSSGLQTKRLLRSACGGGSRALCSSERKPGRDGGCAAERF